MEKEFREGRGKARAIRLELAIIVVTKLDETKNATVAGRHYVEETLARQEVGGEGQPRARSSHVGSPVHDECEHERRVLDGVAWLAVGVAIVEPRGEVGGEDDDDSMRRHQVGLTVIDTFLQSIAGGLAEELQAARPVLLIMGIEVGPWR